MAERIRITVQPSAAHPDLLSVQDAMRQVNDFFEYLALGSPDIVWNLVHASTNSPLTVEAEAIPAVADLDITVAARMQKARLAQDFRALIHGEEPSDIEGTERIRVAERIFRRNTNGIGATVVTLDEGVPPLLIEPTTAKVAVEAIETHNIRISRQRVEVGSVEGRLIAVDHYYRSPAILIQERTRGQLVHCRVTEETREQISKEVDFQDVWDGRRVIVRGKIRYNRDGKIESIDAARVERIQPGQVQLNDLYDRDFTGGLDPATYLEMLREGELGG